MYRSKISIKLIRINESKTTATHPIANAITKFTGAKDIAIINICAISTKSHTTRPKLSRNAVFTTIDDAPPAIPPLIM